MQELGIRSTVTPKKPAYKKGDCYKKFENHLNREFHAGKPNEKWCTDFTYIFMEDGRKRYNCSIIDLFDRSVVATLNSCSGESPCSYHQFCHHVVAGMSHVNAEAG